MLKPITFIALLIAGPLYAATPSAKDLVQAELVADVSKAKAGEPFNIGVRLKLKLGYHVYWKASGASGLPTKIKFELPEGVVASELKFPVPLRIVEPGGIVVYGYHDEVMLTATISTPAFYEGKSVPIGAKLSYLVCNEDRCLPGKADLKLYLPLASSREAVNVEEFARWEQRVPVEYTRDPNLLKIEYKFEGADIGVVNVTFKAPPKEVQWFPGPTKGFDIEKVESTTTGEKSKMTFHLLPANTSRVQMPVVVAYIDSEGNKRSFERVVEFARGTAQAPPATLPAKVPN